jgi:Holliday junction resolvase RusA-like endonuclease
LTFQVIFSVYGQPVPKKRPRVTRYGHAYTPKESLAYENEVALMAKSAMGSSEALETPVAAYIYINYAVPPSYSKKRKEACLNGSERPTGQNLGDIDNVAKQILDACNGIVYKDDRQVVSLHVTKRFDSIASVHVCIREELE